MCFATHINSFNKEARKYKKTMAIIPAYLFVVELVLKYLILNGYTTNDSLLEIDTPNYPFHEHKDSVLIEKLGYDEFSVYPEPVHDKNLKFSAEEAKDLGLCISKQLALDKVFQINRNCDDLDTSTNYCVRELNGIYSNSWRDDEMENFSKGVLQYLKTSLPIKCKTSRKGKVFQFLINGIEKRLRRKRASNSEDKSEDNCEMKLAESFTCYRTELSHLSEVLKSSEFSGLSPQARTNQQNDAGCDLIGNILNRCDKHLCNPSSPDSDANVYNEYVRTILPDFDIQRCGQF